MKSTLSLVKSMLLSQSIKFFERNLGSLCAEDALYRVKCSATTPRFDAYVAGDV